VDVLHLMQKKIAAEREKQQKASGSSGDLSASIQAAKDKIEALTASIKADSERKQQTQDSLNEHTSSRDEAKDTVEKATALRGAEAAAFAKFKSDSDANIAALSKAIPLIATREELLAFLSGGQHEKYVPQSGEIVGILKTMHDEMTAGLGDATTQETSAIQNFEDLMAAKSKEIATLQKQIEEEMTRLGDLSVKISGEENDLEDTRESFSEDEKFKLDLEKSCETKTKDWKLIKKTRAEEQTALAASLWEAMNVMLVTFVYDMVFGVDECDTAAQALKWICSPKVSADTRFLPCSDH